MLLRIKDLSVPVMLGVFDWEKESPRSVLINVAVVYDEGEALQTDTLEDTLDYAALEQAIIAAVTSQHFNLIEHMLMLIGQAAMEFPNVLEVVAEVEKPGALRQSAGVSISATFQREES